MSASRAEWASHPAAAAGWYADYASGPGKFGKPEAPSWGGRAGGSDDDIPDMAAIGDGADDLDVSQPVTRRGGKVYPSTLCLVDSATRSFSPPYAKPSPSLSVICCHPVPLFRHGVPSQLFRPQVANETVQQLLAMGFPLARALHAHEMFGDDLENILAFLTNN